MRQRILLCTLLCSFAMAQLYQQPLVGSYLSYPSVSQYQQLSYGGERYGENYGPSIYRPATVLYRENSYPMQYGSSYSSITSPYYSGMGNYGHSLYGRSIYDSSGYNPLLQHSHYSPMETSGYLSMIHDKENFQPQGCGWDAIQQRCTDGLGICRGGCRDFSNAYSTLRDCRCIPYGYAALMKMLTGLKKARKA